jgi:hypothetical protein
VESSLADIIGIADHAERLTRLYVMDRERQLDGRQLDDELENVFHRVFGCSWADYDDDLFPEKLVDWWDELDEEGAQAYALSRGYSLVTHTGAMLEDWESYLELIIAKEYGLIATTAEEKGALRLKWEAQAFENNKRKGVIRG